MSFNIQPHFWDIFADHWFYKSFYWVLREHERITLPLASELTHPELRRQHCINATIALWQHCFRKRSTGATLLSDCSAAPLCCPQWAGRSMCADILSHSSPPPDMIYAVPLASLSPPSSLSALTPYFFFHAFRPSFCSLCPCEPAPFLFASLCCNLFLLLTPPPPLFLFLCRALCPMGIRVAQQNTSVMARRGKLMRRSSWPTMWGTLIIINVLMTEGKFHPTLPDKTSGVCTVLSFLRP